LDFSQLNIQSNWWTTKHRNKTLQNLKYAPLKCFQFFFKPIFQPFLLLIALASIKFYYTQLQSFDHSML